MKKKLFIGTMLALLALFAAVPCFAATVVDSGNCGDSVTYTFYDDGKMIISGSGSMDSYMEDYTAVPWYNYKNAIKTLEVLEGVKNVNTQSFSDCTNLIDVKLADSVTDLGISVFSGCSSLKNINISNITHISWNAFSDCSSLESIHISANTRYVWTSWESEFEGCISLKSITVDSQHEEFSDIDGVFFSKDKTGIYHYPAAKPGNAYSIPDSVSGIFATFSDCRNLTALEIPTSVTSFVYGRYGNLFNNSSITDIYYNGTEEQWNEIKNINQVDFTGISIHFNSTLPEEAPPFKVTYFDDYCKVENISDTTQQAYITVAGYTNNGALGEITEYQYTSLESGGSFTYDLPANGKIFVWDSIEGMKPLNK